MTRTWRKYHLLVLAVIFAAALAAGSWFATAPVYAEEGDFGKICFNGDSDYDWAHVYNVENKGDSLSLEELNITVLDGDTPKDPDSYELSVEHVYFDEDQDREVGDPVESPYGIREENQYEGFTQYRAIATSTDNSEVWCEGNFVVADKHSLNFVCAEINPGQGTATWAEGWRMHDRFWFNPETDIDFSVKHVGDDEALTEGTDYEVKYYRVARPEDMDNEDVPTEEILIPDDEEYLVTDGEGRPTKPTEPGSYFATIRGLEPYYGGNDVLIDIDSTPRIVLRSEEGDLWSDDTLTYRVQLPEGVDGDLGFYGGIVSDWEATPREWDLCFTGEPFFEYDETEGTLTLNGAKIYQQYQESNIRDGHLDIWAKLSKNEGGQYTLLAEGFADADVREARYEYDLPENDDLLPEWTGWIDGTFHVYIENKQYPEGKDWDLDITGARIDSDPADAITLEEKNGGWEYKARTHGNATITLEYNDIDGESKEHSFEVVASDHVYRADFWPVEGINQGLPGTSIELQADAEHSFINRNEDDPDDWWHDSTRDGLDYYWRIEGRGNEFATIKENANDPSKATLTLKELPAGQENIGEQIIVKVSVTDTNSDDPVRERASNEKDFWINSDYMQIMPAQIESGLDVGKSLTIDPELWHYQLGKKGHEVIDADFEIDNVDENAIDVDENDGVFTITRKGDWETNFNIRAYFRWEDGREDDTDQWYHLDDKDYRPEFRYRDMDIYQDQEIIVPLDGEDLDGIRDLLDDPDNNDFRVEYTVGVWDGGDEQWIYTLDPEEGGARNYTADSSGLTINGDTVDRAVKAAREETGDDNINGLNVHAELFINNESYDPNGTWCWLNLRRPCMDGKHKWHKYTVREATLDNEGLEYWVCPEHPVTEGCGEFREVVIPKKIDIAKASVAAIKTVTYNKKAQKPAVTVKYDGETLKAGTDYSIAYVNNTNAGKATVVLVGKDRFAGDKNATFTIAKANNPIKVTVKKPSVKFTAVKKKNQTIKQKAAYTVSGNQGKVTWKKASGNAKITVAANGNITVKKGLKKGTYKVKVKATAKGNANYKSGTKTVTVKVAVK